jgi:hypothetical protein
MFSNGCFSTWFWTGPEGDLRVYLERLAEAENVQEYVAQHPFGQRAITESDPSWGFYSRIASADSCQSQNVASTSVTCQPWPRRNASHDDFWPRMLVPELLLKADWCRISFASGWLQPWDEQGHFNVFSRTYFCVY